MSSKRSPQSPPPPRYHDGLILNEEALKIYPELVPTPPPRVHHDSPASQAPIASRASQPNGRDWDTGLHPIEKRRHRAALFWKRPIVWVVVVAAIIIVVLAGILGAVASGKIKIASLASTYATDATSGNGSGGTGTSGTAATATTVNTPSGQVTLECPAANGTTYTSTKGSQPKTFLKTCDWMLNDGDGDLGLAKGTFLNMASCIDACAQQTKCVAVVFNSTPSCYLKEFVYYKTATVGYEYAVLQT